tara:strand:+ start:24542 stop:25327 length:786 start_codon:yes stop_codon:yes gene_type:complete
MEVSSMNKLSIPSDWLDRKLKVALVGCGGTGSEMIDELFRMHTLIIRLGGNGLNVTAFDPKLVNHANVGRQRFWHADIGYQKAEILITRLNSFGGVHWEYRNVLFEPNLITNFDIVITCVDSPVIRARIGQFDFNHHYYSSKTFRLWLDCGNDSHSGNVILGNLGDKVENYIPNVYDLYPVLGNMPDDNEPSCSTEEALEKQDYGINRSVAREGANLLWQLIRHGSLSHHGSYINIQEGTVTPLKICSKQWSVYGYHGATN